MERSKNIKILLTLWIIVCIIFIIHVIFFFNYGFIVEYKDLMNNFVNIGNFALSLFALIATITILISYFTVKKWSWLINVIFSFYFFVHYGYMFLEALGFIVFFSSYQSSQHYFSIPTYITWLATVLILPFLLTYIIILLFKSDVKTYFKINL